MILLTNDSTLEFNASSSIKTGVVMSSSLNGLTFDKLRLGCLTGGKLTSSAGEGCAIVPTSTVSSSTGLSEVDILGLGVINTVGDGLSLVL